MKGEESVATKLIHISDIHYRKNWEENHGVVMRALVSDIKAQMDESRTDTFYAIFSGDIVQAADDQDSYNSFLSTCGKNFDDLGIPRSHRFCVPGNHDVSRKHIQLSILDHEGIVSQKLDETSVNDYIKCCNSVFKEKFCAYQDFESEFTNMPAIATSVAGNGYKLDEQLGVYCLNSALFSSGGLQGSTGELLIDKERLVVETRELHSWVAQCDAPCKVLVTHHPLAWLSEWASQELNSLLNREFSLFLSGHSHDQKSYHLIVEGKSFVHLHAPPLFTSKSETLGYSIITICPNSHRVSEVAYRQWTGHQRFLPGVSFSGTDDGKLTIFNQTQTNSFGVKNSFDPVEQYLSNELEDALTSFSSQPRIWVEPIISEKPETYKKAKEVAQYNVPEIVSAPVSTVIQAPGQFVGFPALPVTLHYRLGGNLQAPFGYVLMLGNSNQRVTSS
jgi:predicted MPP superfamily phosphohydrolase